MRLAFSGAEERYRDVPIGVMLGDAREHGVDFIELWHPWNTSAEGVEHCVSEINTSGIQVAAVSALAHLATPDVWLAQRDLLMKTIKIAATTGAHLVNTYFGHAEEQDDDALISAYAERLAPCLEQAIRSDITIVLENECDITGEDPKESDITRRPESIVKLMECVDSPHFRLTYDAVNFYLAGTEPFPYAYNVVSDFIAYIHIKDGARYRSRDHPPTVRTWEEHAGQYVALTVGEGAVNHEGLLRRLRDDGYEGFVTLEPHVRAARLLDTYVKSIEYLERHGVGK